MRKVHEILQLSRDGGLSTRVVGPRTGVSATTVRGVLTGKAYHQLPELISPTCSFCLTARCYLHLTRECRICGGGFGVQATFRFGIPDWKAHR